MCLFFNNTIDEIKHKCEEIIGQLNNNMMSTKIKDLQAIKFNLTIIHI